MSATAKKVATVGIACLVLATLAKRSSRSGQLEIGPSEEKNGPLGLVADIKGEARSESDARAEAIHGIMVGDDIELVDWTAWMERAPDMLRVTLLEGERDPEIVVANLFRRIYPDHPWPPSEGSAMYETWRRMVAFAGRSLERPFKPHFEVVS